jgi:hypothetical protein
MESVSAIPGVELLTNLGLNLHAITQVYRQLSDIAKCLLVRKLFISEVYIARCIFHEIDEGQTVDIGRLGRAN